MSDEQWLREGLADAVPEPPTNPDRARAAERLARRRRRTTALAVVGTAGAVAAAAVLTAALASGGDDRMPVDTASNAPATVAECPPIKVAKGGTAEESEIDRPDPDAPGSVPEGATSARLCQGPGTTFELPADALTTDVDSLVGTVNALEQVPAPEMCTLDLGPGFRIAFGYDDGSSFVVSGRLYGCRTLVVGNGYRADPERAQDEFLSLLETQQASTNESGESPSGTVACPDGPSFDYDGIDDIQEGLQDAVPEGATSVRLCAGGGNPGAQPLDALTTDVAALVGTVNGLPDGARGACNDDLGPGYRLAFGYPDGSRFLVVGRFYGCANVVVGSGYRDDPQVPLDEFIRLLRSQRSAGDPPVDDRPAPGCDQTFSHPTFELGETNDIVAAAVCATDGVAGTTQRGPVPAGDLDVLVADMSNAAVDLDRPACDPSPERYSTSIVAITSWGDPLVLNSDCRGFSLPRSMRWLPSASAQAILDRLINEVR